MKVITGQHSKPRRSPERPTGSVNVVHTPKSMPSTPLACRADSDLGGAESTRMSRMRARDVRPEYQDHRSLNMTFAPLDVDGLGAAAMRLPAWKRVAFMAACCERMLPNYEHFARETGFGRSAMLREVVDVAWDWIQNDELAGDPDKLATLANGQAPDTAAFASRYASAALDAAAAVALLMQTLAEPDGEGPAQVSRLAFDSIDLFVQEELDLAPADPQFERAIQGHPLMKAEWRRQHANLETLLEVRTDREQAAFALRTAWSRLERGSLDESAE